ncbi:MAG: SMC-Scp complex subunit ScpB [Candidatus Berkiella sp.]
MKKPTKSMNELIRIVEGAIFAAGAPLSPQDIIKLFEEDEKPAIGDVRKAIEQLQKGYEKRGITLVEVASGYRFQVADHVAPYIAKSTEERPARYSRALLETLALIAYRQPITRGEIEDIRGVVVSTNIIKTLDEQEWIRVVGYKDVPGKPALYATTKMFLDHFGLKSLEELPPLSELKAIETINLNDEVSTDEAAALMTQAPLSIDESQMEEASEEIHASIETDDDQASAAMIANAAIEAAMHAVNTEKTEAALEDEEDDDDDWLKEDEESEEDEIDVDDIITHTLQNMQQEDDEIEENEEGEESMSSILDELENADDESESE